MGLIIQVRIQWWMQVHPHRKDSATAATVQVELTNANATLAPRQCQVLLKEKFESIKLLSQTSTTPGGSVKRKLQYKGGGWDCKFLGT